jgi:hypothetical protein
MSLYRSQWAPADALLLAEMITESLHQGLDGWNKKERKVIERYLADIELAMEHGRVDEETSEK